MKIFVLGSCTAKKKFKRLDITCEVIDKFGREKLIEREDLKDMVLPARDMYLGGQHLYTVKAIDLLRSIPSIECVDFYILSAGFGLLEEQTLIPPYECTFGVMSKEEIRHRSKKLRIEEKLIKILEEKNYDIAFFLLGVKYLIAIEEALKSFPTNTLHYFYVSRGGSRIVPQKENFNLIFVDRFKVKNCHVSRFEIKGFLFHNLARKLSRQHNKIKEALKNPSDVIKLHLMN
ncbi:MAG: DUF6884 domain-containing protein [Candidatus Baldrarchaeia archaeon]